MVSALGSQGLVCVSLSHVSQQYYICIVLFVYWSLYNFVVGKQIL